MTNPTDFLLLVGRIVFGGYFLWSGFNHFLHWKTLAQYAAAKGTPAPALAVLGTGGLLVGGSLSVITGILPMVGLGLLALFLIGVTPMMHAFWRIQDPMMRLGETVNFSKNLALLGAVLALTALPQPWTFSVAVGS